MTCWWRGARRRTLAADSVATSIGKAPSRDAQFRAFTVPVTALGDFKDALHDIHVGKLDLLIVEGVLDPSTCAAVVRQLEDPANQFAWTMQEHRDPRRKQFYLLGESLTPYVGHPEGPDMAHYFAEAASFREVCARLFAGQHEPDFEAHISKVFARMGGGRAIRVPDGEQPNTRYHGATIRALPVGCEIPVHVGNYFLTTPAYRHLATIVDLKDQLSYFVPLQVPDAGGELVVYRTEWGQDVPAMTRDARGGWDQTDEAGDRWPAQRFAPGAGALLLFNGGRFYHRVSTAQGSRARWTIGGFASFSADGSTVYFWS